MTILVTAMAIAALSILVLRLSYPLPSLEGRTESRALAPGKDGPVGQFVEPLASRHPGKTGIYPLFDAKEALAARILLAKAARYSIDAQYYIWHDDLTGRALLNALVEAADRGVRIRLLLDDTNTSGMDPLLAAMDGHAHVEVRLFNPFMQRSARMLGFASDFFRLNRRMHNKSFTVDNQATIVGGRNIGDEYFDASSHLSFIDADVLALGQAAHDTSGQFDQYWASGSSYPAAAILADASPGVLADLSARVRGDLSSAPGRAYRAAVVHSKLVEQLEQKSLPLEWVEARLFYDDPAKGLGKAEAKLLLQDLTETTEPARKSLDVVSAYFVPGGAGHGYFTDQANRGLAVRVVTNSQQATDVLPVHSGYIRYRRRLLESGVELHELKSTAGGHERKTGLFGSSSSSLHSKLMMLDRERIFIGSFNFDPRSARLNCELGLMIDSPMLASTMAELVDGANRYMYRPSINADGGLRWSDTDRPGQDWDVEPNTSLASRVAVKAMSLLPIEWLL